MSSLVPLPGRRDGASARAFPPLHEIRARLAAPVVVVDDHSEDDNEDSEWTSLVESPGSTVLRLEKEQLKARPTSLVDPRRDATDQVVQRLQQEADHWKRMYFLALEEVQRLPRSSSPSRPSSALPSSHHCRNPPRRPRDDDDHDAPRRSSTIVRREDDDDDAKTTTSKRENGRYQVMRSPGSYRFMVNVSASANSFVSDAFALGRGRDQFGALLRFPPLSTIEALNHADGVPIVIAKRGFVWDHRNRVQLTMMVQPKRIMGGTTPIVLHSLSPTNKSLLSLRRSLHGSLFVYESYRSDREGRRRVITSFGVRQESAKLILAFVKLVVRT